MYQYVLCGSTTGNFFKFEVELEFIGKEENEIGIVKSCSNAKYSIPIGKEVVAVNKKLPYGKVHDSNRFTLTGMLKKNNVDVIDLGHAKDNITDIKRKFKKAIKESDLVISTGGVSVGDADYIKDVVKSLGNIN